MKVGSLMIEMAADLVRLRSDLNAAVGSVDQATRKITGYINKMKADFGKLASGFVIALSIKGLARVTSEMTDIESRLARVVGGADAARGAMGRLNDMALRTYSDFAQTAESYLQTEGALRAMGYTTNQTMNFVETLNNAMVVSGAKAERATQVQNALSKAMALGKLSGDQLNTVISVGGRVADLLAERLGVNVNQLRALGKEGKITGNVIYEALAGNMEKVRKEAEEMPATISDGIQRIGTVLQKMVYDFDKASGASSAVAAAIVWVADNMKLLATIAAIAGAGLLAAFAPTIIASIVAMGGAVIKLGAAMMSVIAANPFIALAAAIGATIAALTIYRHDILLGIDDTTSLGDLGAEAFSRIGDTAIEAWGYIKGLFSGSATEADNLDTATRQSTENQESWWLGMLRTVAQAWDALAAISQGFFTGLGRIGQATIAALGSGFTALGRAAMQALSLDFDGAAQTLREGIKSVDIGGIMDQSMLDAAASVRGSGVESLLDSLIAGAAERGKERTKAEGKKAGENFGDGVTKGLNDSKGKVSKAAAELLHAMRSEELGIDPKYYEQLNLLFGLYTSGAIKIDEYRKRVEQLTAKQEFAKKIQQELINQARFKAEIDDAAFEREEKARKQTEGQIRTGREMLAAIKFETSALTMNSTERKVAIALRDLERQGIVEGTKAYEEYADKIRAAIVDKELVEANLKAQEQIADEWKKTSESIGQQFTDALIQGGASVKDALKRMFQNLVLRPIIQPIMTAVGGMLASLTGGLMGGGGGAGGALGMASNANSAFGFAGLISNWMGTGVGAGMGTLAYGNLIGAMGGDGLGAFIAANGGWGTSGLGALGSSALTGLGVVAAPLIIGALIEKYGNNNARITGAATSGNNAVSVTPGALDYNILTGALPDREALLAELEKAGAPIDKLKGLNDRQLILALLQSGRELDPERMGKPTVDGGWHPPNWDNFVKYVEDQDFYRGLGYANPETLGWWSNDYFSGSGVGIYGGNQMNVNSGLVQFSRDMALSINNPLEAIGKLLGDAEAKFETTVGLSYDADKKRGWQAGLSIVRDGKEIVSFGARGDEGNEMFKSQGEALRAIYEQALGAFKTLDLPEWAKDQADAAKEALSKLTDDETGEKAAAIYAEAANAISLTMAAIKNMIDVFPEFAGATQDTVYAIAEAAGGLDKLNAGMQGYYANFYSQAEREAMLRKQLTAEFDKLGYTLPDTRDGFRGLIDSLDLTTEEGRKAFAALIGLSDIFAQLVPDTEKFVADLSGLAGDLASTITSVMLGTFEGEDPGAAMAQVVSNGIYAAIAGEFANQITQIIVKGVVDPIVTAAVTGAAVTGVVSKATIAEMVAQAQAVAAALGKIFDDPDFLAAIDDISEALGKIKIPVAQLKPPTVAIKDYTSAVKDSGKASNAAADAIKRAWESITNSLLDQVRKIRGEMGNDGPNSVAYWQSQFAIDTAAARAGDQDAAKRLVGISDSLLRAAIEQSGSMLELQELRAWVAQSLQDTAGHTAGFTGTTTAPAVPISTPGAAPYVPMAPRVIQTDPGLLVEVRQLRQQTEAQARLITDLALRTTRVLERWDTNGMPEERVEA